MALSNLEWLAAKRMRMLRLSRGWSAERLAQEYAKTGFGLLSRVMIAKIECGIRLIRAGEAEGVARAFGLTSGDLLDPDGLNIFLSYADDDNQIGEDIATWLSDHGFRILTSGTPERGYEVHSFTEPLVMEGVQAFVILLTPSYLSSPRCCRELDQATRFKQSQPTGLAEFIYVIRIGDTPYPEGFDLRSCPVTDLAQAAGRTEAALSNVGAKIMESRSRS